MQRPVRDETYFEFGQGLSLGLISSHLLTAGTHTGAQRRAHKGIKHPTRDTQPGAHPLVKALALQGVSGDSGRLACIRKDALAGEVLASTC